MEMRRESKSKHASPATVEDLVTLIQTEHKGTSIRNLSSLEIARAFLEYSDTAGSVASHDTRYARLDDRLINKVAPYLKELLRTSEGMKDAEHLRSGIREQFKKAASELFGDNVSQWSRSDSWIYADIAEDFQKTNGKKQLPEDIEDHVEAASNERLGWEARFQSWRLDTRSKPPQYVFDSRYVLDKLNPKDPSYKDIKEVLTRPYREQHAGEYDSTFNPVALMRENFPDPIILRNLGLLIRQNLESKKPKLALVKDNAPQTEGSEQSDTSTSSEKEKTDPWAEAPLYSVGDQILYQRPTGEWAIGELIDEPEEITKGQRKFKVKALGAKKILVEDYTTATPPRLYEDVQITGPIKIGSKEYTAGNKHIGTNRVEFDLQEVGGDKKVVNVDSEVIRAAVRAEKVAQNVEAMVEKLKVQVEKGVSNRAGEVGEKFLKLSAKAREVEKLLGSSPAKLNKLTLERTQEIHRNINEIQQSFEKSIVELQEGIKDIQKATKETGEAAGKRLIVDQFNQTVAERLQQLDTLTLARNGGMSRLSEWQDQKAKYDAWVAGGSKEPKVDNPGKPPFELPSTNKQEREKVFNDVLGALDPENPLVKEIQARMEREFGKDLSGLSAADTTSQEIKDRQIELEKREAQRVSFLREKRLLEPLKEIIERLGKTENERLQAESKLTEAEKEKKVLLDELEQLHIRRKVLNQSERDVPALEKQLTDLNTQIQEQEALAAASASSNTSEKGKKKGLKDLTGLSSVIKSADEIKKLQKEKILVEIQLSIGRLYQNRDQIMKEIDEKISEIEKSSKPLLATIGEQRRIIKDCQEKEKNEKGLLDKSRKKIPDNINSALDEAIAKMHEQSTVIAGLKTEIVSLKKASVENLQQRTLEMRAHFAREVIGEWQKFDTLKIDFTDQKKQLRDTAQTLRNRIDKLRLSSRAKAPLEQSAETLLKVVDAVKTDDPRTAEQAIASIWAHEIHALELAVYAKELQSDQSADSAEYYENENLAGHLELPASFITELLATQKPALDKIVTQILEKTVITDTFKPGDSTTEYTRVKSSPENAMVVAELFDKVKTPDHVILSKFGIRKWDDFVSVWKETLAPQVSLYIGETIGQVFEHRARRAELELEAATAARPPELQKGWRGKILRRKVQPEVTPAEIKELHDKIKEELKRDLPAQMSNLIGSALTTINTEYRIHRAAPGAERAAIVALSGFTEQDRLSALIQGTYLLGQPAPDGSVYRLEHANEKSRIDKARQIVDALSKEQYTRTHTQVQAKIEKLRFDLDVMQDHRLTGDPGEENKKILAVLEKDTNALLAILNYDDSADPAQSALGNADPELRTQIVSLLTESRQYIPFEAAVLSKEEKDLLETKKKIQTAVATIEHATAQVVENDTSGIAKEMHEALEASHAHDADSHGHGDHDDHGGYGKEKKKGPAGFSGLRKWTVALGLLLASGVGAYEVGHKYAQRQAEKADVEAKKNKDRTKKTGSTAYEYGNLDAYKKAYTIDNRFIGINENSLEVRAGDFEHDIGPSNPLVNVIDFNTHDMIKARDPEAARGFIVAIKSIVKDPTYSATDPNKVKAERKLINEVAVGYRDVGLILDQPEYASTVKGILEAAKQKKSKEVLEMLRELSRTKIEPKIDASAIDKETGLPLFIKANNKEGVITEMEKLKSKAEAYYKAHPITPEQINKWADEAVELYVLDESPKSKQEMKAMLLATLYSESTFNPAEVSDTRGGGYGIGQTAASVMYGYPSIVKGLVPNAFIGEKAVKHAMNELQIRLNQYPNMKYTFLAYVWGQNRESLKTGNIERLNIEESKAVTHDEKEYVKIRHYANRGLVYRDFYRTHSYPERPPLPPKEILNQPLEVRANSGLIS